VFDAQWKYTWDEKAGSGALRTTLGDEPADDPRAAARYHLEYLRLQRNSRYGHLGPVGSTPAEQAALEDRLRSLGYL
jgi:hypothetical protein